MIVPRLILVVHASLGMHGIEIGFGSTMGCIFDDVETHNRRMCLNSCLVGEGVVVMMLY